MSLDASSAAPARTSTAGVIAVRRPGCAGRQPGSWRYLRQTVSAWPEEKVDVFERRIESGFQP